MNQENSTQPTHAVPFTPPGRGAIAVVVVDGPRAVECVDACFARANGRSIAATPVHRIAFGRWHGPLAADQFDNAIAPGEEVVVRRRSPSCVEVQCHGGAAAVSRICGDLASQGCAPVDWTQWRRIAGRGEGDVCITGDLFSLADPIAVEADMALADVTTERAALILLEQRQGRLRGAVDQVREMLVDDAGDAASLRQAADAINALLQRAAIGRHLVEPWRVAVGGWPNVGKSSLLNALLGFSRTIVFDQPGTTRDVVSAHTAIDGWPVELSDTAGIRPSDDPIERAGVDLALSQFAAADLVVAVFDGSEPWTESDADWLASLAWPVVVYNKVDRLDAATIDRERMARPEGLWISALSGDGVGELIAAIAARIMPEDCDGEAVPFTGRQSERLTEAAVAISTGDVPAALLALHGVGNAVHFT